MSANNRRVRCGEELLKHTVPTLDRGLALRFAVPEEVLGRSFCKPSSAFTVSGGNGQYTGVPVFCVYRNSLSSLRRARSRQAAS